MYYAYKDLRTEQAWTRGSGRRPIGARRRRSDGRRWNTGRLEVLATRSLACPGTEKARAVHALGAVEASRLNQAIADWSNREHSHSGWTLSPNRGNPFLKP